jgi:hypothetical protein
MRITSGLQYFHKHVGTIPLSVDSELKFCWLEFVKKFVWFHRRKCLRHLIDLSQRMRSRGIFGFSFSCAKFSVTRPQWFFHLVVDVCKSICSRKDSHQHHQILDTCIESIRLWDIWKIISNLITNLFRPLFVHADQLILFRFLFDPNRWGYNEVTFYTAFGTRTKKFK